MSALIESDDEREFELGFAKAFWKGLLISALSGVAISLMLFLVAYLLLEGIL